MSQEYPNDIVVITDTSCLILLDKLKALDILPSLFQNIVTTSQIADEFGKQLPMWIQVKNATNQQAFRAYLKKVDRGEASAIALALELPNPMLILDDLKGRKLADQLSIRFTGTLGVLVLAKQKGKILHLKPYFEKIKASDFRVPPTLLQNILSAMGEI